MITVRRLLLLQTLVIFGGVCFSWSTLLGQLQKFYTFYGTFFKFSDCVIPNPLATPCFYGSVAFVIALIWSLMVLWHGGSVTSQKWLRNFLAFGVVFAATVLSIEAVQYYHLLGGPSISCAPGVHPLATPCFIGLLFFAASLLISWAAHMRMYAAMTVPASE